MARAIAARRHVGKHGLLVRRRAPAMPHGRSLFDPRVGRTATEKDVKSAYRKLGKELNPESQSGQPQGGERFSEITRATTCSRTRTSARASTAVKSISTATPPGSASAAAARAGRVSRRRVRGFRRRRRRRRNRSGDIFEGLFGGAAGWEAVPGEGLAARVGHPQGRQCNLSAGGLAARRGDPRDPAESRWRAARRSTQAPRRGRGRHPDAACRQGEAGLGGRGRAGHDPAPAPRLPPPRRRSS